MVPPGNVLFIVSEIAPDGICTASFQPLFAAGAGIHFGISELGGNFFCDARQLRIIRLFQDNESRQPLQVPGAEGFYGMQKILRRLCGNLLRHVWLIFLHPEGDLTHIVFPEDRVLLPVRVCFIPLPHQITDLFIYTVKGQLPFPDISS